MTPDAEGFLYPKIQNPELCINCGRCEKVCPIINVDAIQIPTHNLQVYAGFVSETGELQKSASGGIASAISQKIITEGGVVYGVAYSSDFTKAEYRKAETLAELEAFRNSKYIQAEKGTIFSDVKDTLEAGKQVLFIGLPCEVGGLKSFLRKEYANLFTVDLICHGPTSPKVAEEYCKSLEVREQSVIIEFSVRYKKEGNWAPSYMRAKFQNGHELLKQFNETEYGKAFSIFSRPSCNHCCFKGDNHVADLTIGDYWGCTEKDVFWNPHGVSVMFVHTGRGEVLLEQLLDFVLMDADYSHAVAENPMYYQSKEMNPIREIFGGVFADRGLYAACRETESLLENIIKAVWNRLPNNMKGVSRNIYHILKSHR